MIAEYLAGVLTAGLEPTAWMELPVTDLTAVEEALALSLPNRLGAGERTCLAIATNRVAIMASDDYDARHYAQRGGLTVI